MAGEDRVLAGGAKYIDFQTDPSRYRHWKLDVAGDVATLLQAKLTQPQLSKADWVKIGAAGRT